MANSIALFKTYTTLLDEVYKQSSLTSELDGASDLATAGANSNELIIPMISMDGLADYSRNGGYVDGDVTLNNETVKCNFDRGRMFTVDTMDNAETALRLAGLQASLSAPRLYLSLTLSALLSTQARQAFPLQLLQISQPVQQLLRHCAKVLLRWTRTRCRMITAIFTLPQPCTDLFRTLIQQSQRRCLRAFQRL